MQKISILFSLLLCIALAGCSSTYTKELYQEKYSAPPQKQQKDAYYRIKHSLQCVPYAREMSGIQLRGNAHTWWNKSIGHYQRGSKPKVGSIMVLSKTSRLRFGHLAVVKRIIDSRNIEVAHSNWGGDKYTRSYIYRRMPVVDTSPNNDWSQARFWNYPSSSYGSVYAVSGFIYPNPDTKPSLVSTLAPQHPNKVIIRKTNAPIPRMKPASSLRAAPKPAPRLNAEPSVSPVIGVPKPMVKPMPVAIY